MLAVYTLPIVHDQSFQVFKINGWSLKLIERHCCMQHSVTASQVAVCPCFPCSWIACVKGQGEVTRSTTSGEGRGRMRDRRGAESSLFASAPSCQSEGRKNNDTARDVSLVRFQFPEVRQQEVYFSKHSPLWISNIWASLIQARIKRPKLKLLNQNCGKLTYTRCL